MRGLFSIILTLLLLLCPCKAQEAAPASSPLATGPAPLADEILAIDLDEDMGQPSSAYKRPNSPLVDRELTKVSVLGYHNFSETEPITQMLMRTSDFRAQMQYIHDAGLTVISQQEFLDWRFGTRRLPAQCVLITLDDGWRSVYTDAFPILKEFGYPFTIFIYTNYFSGRGLSLSPDMVHEMQQNGASVGSHSTSHPYPSQWTKAQNQGFQAMQEMCEREITQSHQVLTEKCGPIQSYCYPGGYVHYQMLSTLPKAGYVAAFTVIPAKVTSSEDPWQIHRYMIFGNDHSIFHSAMDFREKSKIKGLVTGVEPGTLPPGTPIPPFPVYPEPNSIVPSDTTAVTADFSQMMGINFSSVRMFVSGFAQVPITADSISRKVQWTLPFSIYMPNISVLVTWESTDGQSHKAEWSFRIDQRVNLD